jgi:acyl-CoA dehydrogenase
MIRDQETLNLLLDTISRFVRERLVPNEAASPRPTGSR